MESDDRKRLFFGAHVEAPWPASYPNGRLVPENGRHLTLGFLGWASYRSLKHHMARMPKIPFALGPAGVFDRCLFLPRRGPPRVVAYHVGWVGDDVLGAYQRRVSEWLERCGYRVEKRPFLPHVTVARSPFVSKDWERVFHMCPVRVVEICLYESRPKLEYVPLWQAPLTPAFEEIEHTADRAFCVRGYDFKQILDHAQLALSSVYPPLLAYRQAGEPKHLDGIVETLNDVIGRTDAAIGSRVKAVSYAGEMRRVQDQWLEWEMICDV